MIVTLTDLSTQNESVRVCEMINQRWETLQPMISFKPMILIEVIYINPLPALQFDVSQQVGVNCIRAELDSDCLLFSSRLYESELLRVVLTTSVSDHQVTSFLQVDGEQVRPGMKPGALRQTLDVAPHLRLDTHTHRLKQIKALMSRLVQTFSSETEIFLLQNSQSDSTLVQWLYDGKVVILRMTQENTHTHKLREQLIQ